ncbi:MAG: sodium-translocating pyrophosphatase [Planctomycetaceae bacterium]|jgi:inorganic pyrophosphatase/K(+)-stimulated pyrophosphate-energized sodium pump|nr:sodium-translocating pyrophosphatase [Planctomycetaceae bacterium]
MKNLKTFLSLFAVALFVAAAWIASQKAFAQDEPVVPATETVVQAVSDSAVTATEIVTESEGKFVVFWIFALLCSAAALYFAFKFYGEMKKSDPGTQEMIDIAKAVQEGAYAYLKQQYVVVGIFFVFICIFLGILAYVGVQNPIVPLAFLTGGIFSGLAGFFGMKTATWASNRTAAAAQKSLNQGLQVAFRSGAVMGLTVVGLGLLDIVLWFGILYVVFPLLFHWHMGLTEITVTMLCFGMGASSQALFARVGGGIFTKAADVGADLVGKVEAGIPEDDKRNPATIADNVGDNVGDVAGMGADLYESYCGSILATAALGVAAFSGSSLDIQGHSAHIMQMNALFLPIILAAVGILLSIGGVFLVKTEENATQGTLLKALARGVNISSLAIAVLAIILSYTLLPGYGSVGWSVVMGLAAGWLIGKWTEYSTSDEYKPTKELAGQAKTGPATVIIGGIADGMLSVWCPVVIVGIAMLLSFGFASQWHFSDITYFSIGLYGIGIAAVGMLSTLGITLATDAYGPIADNAGGNAEMSGLDPEVRKRTDALDSLGNTTAATGKGFAIGSAALTALALLAAYVEEVRVGFERWGDSAIVQLIDSKQDNFQPGFYKLSETFIVQAKKAENSQAKLHDGYQIVPFLLVPGQLPEETREEWRKLLVAQEPVLISEEGLVIEDLPAVTVASGDVKEAASFAGVDLIHVKWASMKDWMTYYSCDLMNPKVIVGVFLGAMAVFLFSALTMKAVGRAAFGMVEEVRRQFKEKPGIMNYTEKPDYREPVRISTAAAQREMIVPSVIGLVLPLLTGLILGVSGVIGLLIGTLTTGFCVAVFMANAGGSWDNAKKYIEAGHLGGKGSDAHKAAVVGDTVGDPFKDTSGPSLNILIKLMNMVSVVAAGFIVRFSLEALGWF